MINVKYNKGDLLKCISRTTENHEGLILDKVYTFEGVSIHDDNVVYAVKDEAGHLFYAMDRFEKVSTPVKVQTASMYGEFKKPLHNEFSDVDRFKMLQYEMLETYIRKNADYGNSVRDTYNEFGLVSFVVRMADKFNRLKNLVKNGEMQVKDEAIRDTIMDLSVYGMLAVIEEDADKEVTTVYASEREDNAVQRPITKKQIQYIAGLTSSLGQDRYDLPSWLSPLPNYKELTEAEAITLIDRLVTIKNYLEK